MLFSLVSSVAGARVCFVCVTTQSDSRGCASLFPRTGSGFSTPLSVTLTLSAPFSLPLPLRPLACAQHVRVSVEVQCANTTGASLSGTFQVSASNPMQKLPLPPVALPKCGLAHGTCTAMVGMCTALPLGAHTGVVLKGVGC